MNKKYVPWMMAGALVALGTAGVYLKEYLDKKLEGMHLPPVGNYSEIKKDYEFRNRALGILYPEMWDGDALGNYWIDEKKAPVRILDGDALGNYWVSEDKIMEDLRNIYQRCGNKQEK
ncbi:MAG: hypothetical protein WCV90_01945 [Candidatus Woesearchaeota archaeon]|jgi:hypothetical protein